MSYHDSINSAPRDPALAAATLILALAIAGCSDSSANTSPTSPGVVDSRDAVTVDPGPYEFSHPVFDIDAAPDGSIFLAETVAGGVVPAGGEVVSTVKAIRPTGDVQEIVSISTPSAATAGKGVPINGLATVGRGDFFATRGGLDLARGAGVLRGSSGGSRLVGDIEAFEAANDPDATAGPAWKTPACEVPGGFSAGAQSNPYHLSRLGGASVIVADAAGNSVLSAGTDGRLDWVALLTPPTADGAGSADPADWLVQFPLGPQTDCYVQPVPTSVAIGPNRDYYIGELTGVTAEDLTGGISTGLSRIWRIAGGSRHAVCPSASCEQILGGEEFTSIIDLAFGPDGMLYVVEYDENGWWGAVVLGNPAGGTISRCDLASETCQVVAQDLPLPSAITFDKWGNLWVLENNSGYPFVGTGSPVVRLLDLD